MPLHILDWFPSAAFANLYGILVLAALLSDELIPRLRGSKRFSLGSGRDRGSFLVIYLASLAGLAGSLYLRLHDVGVVPAWVQVLALLLLVAGAVIREWAIILLGRFFSRIVRIDPGQRLIRSGPYRYVRHPAYTGMVIMDTAIALGLGTWVGALFMFVVMVGASLYRIRVEELALLEAFGDEYRSYMHSTARLFPRW